MQSKAARPLASVTLSQIAREWDLVARKRDNQIRSGLDLSYDRVLVPTVLKLLRSAQLSRVLDAGCGSGRLTELIARRAGKVVGVDLSSVSIKIAEDSPTKPRNVRYVVNSIQRFAVENTSRRFSVILANMLFQDTPNLYDTLSALGHLMKSGGVLVWTITHPWFWPQYRSYASAPWFHYDRELAIADPFRISRSATPVGTTTHFHRPLCDYFDAFWKSGFSLVEIAEPMPDQETERKYPRRWKYPRFLAGRCIRKSGAGPRTPGRQVAAWEF